MAERRMFAKSVVLSGPFIRLPAKTQLLYFHLGMQADDEGFVSAPEFAMQGAKATWKDLNLLVKEGFLLKFPSGLLVIRHWFTHNNIKKDRFRPTVHQEELEQLFLRDKVYELAPNWLQSGTKPEPEWNQSGTKMDTEWSQSGTKLEPQIKPKEIKEKEINLNQTKPTPGSGAGPGIRGDVPRLVDVICYAMEHDYVSDVAQFYNYYQDAGWMEGGRPVYNWRKLLKKWEEDHAGTP